MAQSQSSSGMGATAVEPAWDELRSLVGAEHLRAAGPADFVCGVQPSWVAEPGSENELAAALRWANDAGLAVAPRGGGTKLGWGNPPARLDLILSTTRLNHILEHAWADLTVIVEAGVTVAQLQRALAEHGQHLATDPLWPENATIGGILSTNESGTLRLRFGALRDLIIGVTLALPDGTLAKSGGKVVKNVAGYDMPKLVTGALGTLGVITQAAFRLHPAPRQARSLTFRLANFEGANKLILAAQDSKMAHTGLQAHFAHDAQPSVDLRFEGTTEGIEAQSATAGKLAAPVSGSDSAAEVWNARQELCASPQAGTALAKFSVLPSRIAAACEAVRRAAEKGGMQWKLVVQGTGLGWLRLDAPRPEGLHAAFVELRNEFERDTGSLFVAHRPAGMARLDAWGSPGDAFPVMLRIKQQFDPRGTLNPGRFVGGI